MTPRLRRHNALIAFARVFSRGTPGLGRRISAIPRLIKASIKGEYDGGMRLFLMAAASVYIVSPIDAIPEAIFLFVGLIDDAFVTSWLVGTLLSETERFLEWEKERGRGPAVVPSDVINR